MNANPLYEQIKDMIYKDIDKAEKMLLDADDKKLLDNEEIVYLSILVGAQYRVRDELSKAKKILNTAIKKSEDNDNKAEAYKYLALSFYDEENYAEAMKFYEQALSLAKDAYIIASTYQGMGDVLYALNKKEESLSYYLKSLDYFYVNRPELWEDIESSLAGIIHLYLYLGDKSKADVYINRIITNPRSSSWIIYRVYYNLAHYHYRREDWGHALENYKLALSHFDKKDLDILADIYGYLGSCYHQLWELEKARENYQKSLEFTKEEDKEHFEHRKKALKIINEVIDRENN